MRSSLYYAGVGSRDTPLGVCDHMTDIATWLSRGGFILRSGGARGADRAFEAGAGGDCELFLTADGARPELDAFVDPYHPNPKAISGYARPYLRRNACQVLGRFPLESPRSSFVLCWTPGGQVVGGTGHTIRLAHAFSVPVINIACDGWEKTLISRVRELLNPVAVG